MAPSMLSNNGGRKHHLKDQARLDLDGEFEFTPHLPHEYDEMDPFAADRYLGEDFEGRDRDDLWPTSFPAVQEHHGEDLDDSPQFRIVQPSEEGDDGDNASELGTAEPSFGLLHDETQDYDATGDTNSLFRYPRFASSVFDTSRTPSTSLTSPSVSREASAPLIPHKFLDDERVNPYDEGRPVTPLTSYGSDGFGEQEGDEDEDGMYVFRDGMIKARKEAELEDAIDLSSPVYSHYIPVGILRRRERRYSHNPDESIYPEKSVRLLKYHGWVVTSVKQNPLYLAWEAVRIYVLPHDIDRGKTVTPSCTKLRYHLRTVMGMLDVSPESWEGRYDPNTPPTPTPANRPPSEMEPLIYVFNTLKSPKPSTAALPPTEDATRIGMERILEPYGRSRGRGHRYLAALKTVMYPYQRRSAAYMLQKEVVPTYTFDPRLEPFVGPLGNEFYYDPLRATVVRQNTLFLQPHGGVLAEPSGYGKTLICLSLILSTKGQLSRAGPQREPASAGNDVQAPRTTHTSKADKKAPKLSEKVPVKKIAGDKEKVKGKKSQTCPPPKNRKKSGTPLEAPEQEAPLDPRNPLPSATTLVVVPSCLLGFWLSEIEKHFDPKTFSVFVIAGFKSLAPPVRELLRYDIVFITRERLDREEPRLAAHVLNKPGRKPSAAAIRKISPLSFIRWFRLVYDEGHHLARCSGAGKSKMVVQQLHVDRRWAVTSTPAPCLLNLHGDSQSLLAEGSDIQKSLRAKKTFIGEEYQSLAKLRHVFVDFLRLAPFEAEAECGHFAKYYQVFSGHRTRKLHSLRETFQHMIVRHRMDELDSEVKLPQIHQKTVYLEPTYYDKLTLNAFMFILVVNAVTSRRRGVDYIFHPENSKNLSKMVDNMRLASFWWTGIKPEDVLDTLTCAADYLEANREIMEVSDIALLEQGIKIAKTALRCMTWKALTFYDEIGMFVSDFPDHARDAWALDDGYEFDSSSSTTLLGITQASMAQMFATGCFDVEGFDPSAALSGEGIRIRTQMHDRAMMGVGVEVPVDDNNAESNDAENDITMSSWSSSSMLKKPMTEQVPLPAITRNSRILTQSASTPRHTMSLPPDSPLAQTKLTATTSAKLTYLLDRVLALLAADTDETILILYEPNHFAFWIGEALTLLGIEFAVYSGNSKNSRRYNVLKDVASRAHSERVMLFDLRQASFGLDLTCISRVFIVTPVWDRGMERMFIDKVHRLSQDREVFVETLVLKGSFEEKLLKRRNEMKHIEMLLAEEDPLLDDVMRDILAKEGFMPMAEEGEEMNQRSDNDIDDDDDNINDNDNDDDDDDDDDDIEMRSEEAFENPHLRRPAYLKQPHGFFDTHKLAIRRNQPTAVDDDEDEE